MSEGVGWLTVLPGTLALAVLWVLPGYAVLRALGARGLLALGGAPAVTTGIAALRRPCRHSARIGRSPLARAVRT